RLSLLDLLAPPRGEEPVDRGVEMPAVEQAGERVADRRLGDVAVEERVRDGQRDLVAKDTARLALAPAERLRQVVPGDAQGADDDAVADERQADRDHRA